MPKLVRNIERILKLISISVVFLFILFGLIAFVYMKDQSQYIGFLLMVSCSIVLGIFFRNKADDELIETLINDEIIRNN